MSLGSDGPTTASTIAPTTATPTTHPRRNMNPSARARGVSSISTMAMIGIGLSATPTAYGSNWPIAFPIAERNPRPDRTAAG